MYVYSETSEFKLSIHRKSPENDEPRALQAIIFSWEELKTTTKHPQNPQQVW